MGSTGGDRRPTLKKGATLRRHDTIHDQPQDQDEQVEGRAEIANVKLSGKASGSVGTVALLLALTIIAITGLSYLITTVDRGSDAIALVIGFLTVIGGNLCLSLNRALRK